MGSFDRDRSRQGPTRDDGPGSHDRGDGSPDCGASHGRDHGRRTGVDAGSQTGVDGRRTGSERLRTDGGEDRPDDETASPPAVFAHEANDLAEFWTEYPLDFTPDSLRHLDSLVAEHWPGKQFDDADSGVQRGMVVQFGSYFGETLVRHLDAEWVELGGSWAVTLRGESGEATVDVFRVARECLRGQDRFFGTYETVTDEI